MRKVHLHRFSLIWCNLYKFIDAILIHVFMVNSALSLRAHLMCVRVFVSKHRSKIDRKIGAKMKLFMSKRLMSYHLFSVKILCTSNQVIKYCLHNSFSTHTHTYTHHLIMRFYVVDNQTHFSFGHFRCFTTFYGRVLVIIVNDIKFLFWFCFLCFVPLPSSLTLPLILDCARFILNNLRY